MADRWRCPECGDEMGARFERSHLRICASLRKLEVQQFDEYWAGLYRGWSNDESTWWIEMLTDSVLGPSVGNMLGQMMAREERR